MPAPPASFYRRSESLAQKIQDLANEFANMAYVLSQQYDNLNKATNGLLDGTFPWKGMGADKFFETWQEFGTYIQQVQKSCEDTHATLIKLFGRIDDAETQQCWDILLTIAGGIITIISLAAAIAEGGLNPFVDGFFGWAGSFTEQEGSSVLNVSEEITQADTTAAMELQVIEDELTTSPALTGSISGGSSGEVPPTSLDEMTLVGAYEDINNMTSREWKQWVEDYTFNYKTNGNLTRVGGPNTCAPSAAKMLLADNGITKYSDLEIKNWMGYDRENGTDAYYIASGLRHMGLTSTEYNPDMTINQLENETSIGKPIIVILELDTKSSIPDGAHAVLVDGFQDTDLGRMVLIRDPFYSPPRAYMMPLWAFQQVWQYGGLTY